MGQLIVHQKDGLLELDGFLLQADDRLEIRLIGYWVAGIIAHNQRGWYFLTKDQVGIRLQTGLAARLLSLSSGVRPLPEVRSPLSIFSDTIRKTLGNAGIEWCVKMIRQEKNAQ